MGLGGAVFGTLALLGLSALLTQVAWLYLALKLLGGAYLIYLGIRIWRGAGEPLIVPDTHVFEATTLLRSFSVAFVTQISNPKTAVVYGSIFAVLLLVPRPCGLAAARMLVENHAHVSVALAFSARRPQSVYLSFKHWIDRAAGVVMGGLGVRLIAEGVKQ